MALLNSFRQSTYRIGTIIQLAKEQTIELVKQPRNRIIQTHSHKSNYLKRNYASMTESRIDPSAQSERLVFRLRSKLVRNTKRKPATANMYSLCHLALKRSVCKLNTKLSDRNPKKTNNLIYDQYVFKKNCGGKISSLIPHTRLIGTRPSAHFVRILI